MTAVLPQPKEMGLIPALKVVIGESKSRGMVIDATNGRKTKVVITTDSGHVILAAIEPETIAGRMRQSNPR
jgi:regulator of extracellular matrix RemA (YlzA/DUF370 family)